MGQDLNIWERELRLPVEFTPNIDDNLHYHVSYIDSPGTAIIELLAELDIKIDHAERFFLHPRARASLPPHIDGDNEDLTKLNFIYSSKPSLMNWYQLKEGKRLPLLITDVQSKYRLADPEDCILVHTLKVNSAAPRLINAALLHDIAAVTAPRYCFSFALNRLSTNKRLSWAEAMEAFKEFVV
jgi:hypothetical protein